MLKTYRPVTKSSRQMSRIDYRKALSGDRPHKPLKKGGKRDMGRNSFGRITMRHRGGAIRSSSAPSISASTRKTSPRALRPSNTTRCAVPSSGSSSIATARSAT